MNIPNEHDAGNCNDTTLQSQVTPNAPERVMRDKPEPITPLEFFEGVAVNHPAGVQGVATVGRDGSPSDINWGKLSSDTAQWLANKSHERKPAYFTMSAFDPGKVTRFKGRTKNHVVAKRGFWIDIEGSADKFQKPNGPDAGYADGKTAMEAMADFVKATKLTPSFLVLTGSGGIHLHYVLEAPIAPPVWIGPARALVALARKRGFKIDAQCTTDAARIMRAPGSQHQITGKVVRAYRWRLKPYTLEEFDSLTGYVSDTADPLQIQRPSPGKYDLSVNGDALVDHQKFSYVQAAKRCGAMHKAVLRNGADTLYGVWILSNKTAELSIEGPEYAHEIGCGHPSYDPAKTDHKNESLTGGPAGCKAWGDAYGAGGPCDTCEFKGTIKNPAIQLGAIVDANPPGEVALSAPESVIDWVAEQNQRFALVQHGTKLAIVDFKTPSMTGRGVVYGIGFLDVAGFRSMMNGRFAPIQKAGEKQRALSDAWLAHPQRRQYEGLVYGPGEVLPPSILNLWQGFAVEPVAGDVSPWLAVLAALVPNESEQRYVLNWLAWKIQNPGGVPDTILILKGAKGTGKNSLFDPLILLFGRHAMLADDPELIAGRFTWHLMSLSFAVLDEAVFIGDPKQADRVKSRVTAKTMHYEQKGMDPVQGVNRCAFVMLTNHEYVWQATRDERRAVVVEVGEGLRGNLVFWAKYHAWVKADGPASLLHYLLSIDLTNFNPRAIPKGEALRKQVEQTALRDPVAAWWHQCITEGAIRWRDTIDQVVYLNTDGATEINGASLRLSFEQSAANRGRISNGWAAAARRIKGWAGPDGVQRIRARIGVSREWWDLLPPLSVLRTAFTQATQVEVSE